MLTRRHALGGAFAAGSLCSFASIPFSVAVASTAKQLGAIRVVTITSADLAAAADAWVRYMGYHVVSRGKIPPDLAASWGAAAVTGKDYVVLGPASGEPTYLRFIDQAMPPEYSQDKSLGWKTTEITVQNSDQLYERLKVSPFKIIHPPHVIPTYPYLRAMQAEGPSGERLNLTWITEPRTDIPAARSFVGRVFIAVLASAHLPDTLKFFHDMFGNDAGPIRDVPLVPKIELSTIPLSDSCKIEVDQVAPDEKPAPRLGGGLPSGLAIVTFECRNFALLRTKFIGAPVIADLEPYRGREIASISGPSGELIELLEMA